MVIRSESHCCRRLFWIAFLLVEGLIVTCFGCDCFDFFVWIEGYHDDSRIMIHLCSKTH